ncbi:MAG: hypothetical protein CMN76_09585 [Spirochaetaceae bacterium]|nr:hypothetical protein [Spirochaetaceae bacterium]|tara:strand:+ start:83855 stop:84091 length:237 start_codon:yes stop_codon:yes gene_type:complete
MKIGDPVRICQGPFSGFDGVVVQTSGKYSLETKEDRWGNELPAPERHEHTLPDGCVLVEFSMFGQKMQQAIPADHLQK